MDLAISTTAFFGKRLQPTGALREDAIYIERAADQELYDAVFSGEYCAVLAPRQIGKSSLRVRTARRLIEAGIHCAQIDLTALGKAADRDPVAAWYFSLASRIADELELSDPKPFFEQHSALLPADRFGKYLRGQVLPSLSGPVVIFLDEVDYVRALPIDRDEFFVALRALYNDRAQQPELERLSFCLLGVAAPRDLVKNPDITPFNIGRMVRLLDFSREELDSFAPVLTSLGSDETLFLDEIFAWTSGHPYMTQALCQELLRQRGPQAKGSPRERLEQAVTLRFLRSGRGNDDNLSYAEKRLDQSAQKAELLALYRRLLAEGRLPLDGGDPNQQELQICGMAAPAQDAEGQAWLRPRNRIFAQVFSAAWVLEKEAQRQLTVALRRWEESGRRNHELLRGGALADAQKWAKEHQREVTVEESEFLLACVDGARREAEQARLASLASLEQERRARAEAAARTQRRIIIGLFIITLLLVGLLSGLYYQYRRAQNLAVSEAKAKKEASERATNERKLRLDNEQTLAAKQQEFERAERMRQEAQAAKQQYTNATQALREKQAQVEATQHQAEEQKEKAVAARRDLDQEKRTVTSLGAARLASTPEYRLRALVSGMNAIQDDVRSGGRPHPAQWEGLIAAARSLVGARTLSPSKYPYVTAVALAPDNNRVALSWMDGGQIVLLDGASGQEIFSVRLHDKPVLHLSFSKDGKFLASSSMDQTAKILNSTTGQLVYTYPAENKYFFADFADDGLKLHITTFSDRCSNYCIMITSGEVVPILVPTQQSETLSGRPWVHHIDDYSEIGLPGHRSLKISRRIMNLDLSRDSQWLAISDRSGLSILDSHSGGTLQHLAGPDLYTGLQFSADNRHLLSATIPGEIKIWDLARTIDRSWFVGDNHIWSDKISSDGKVLAIRSLGNIELTQIRNGKPLPPLLIPDSDGYVSAIRFLEGGQRLWVHRRLKQRNGGSKSRMEIWDMASHRLLPPIYVPQGAAFAISGDGRHYFLLEEKAAAQVFEVGGKGFLRFWSMPKGVKADAFVPDYQGLRGVLRSDEGLLLVDATNGSPLRSLTLPKGDVPWLNMTQLGTAQFSRQGDYFVATHQQALGIWDLPSNSWRWLRGHSGYVNSFAISPNERYLVSGSADKTIRVWDLATGELWLTIPVDEPVELVAFLDQGERILAVQSNGVARTFPVRHKEWFKFACQVLRGVPQVPAVSDEELKRALSACPPQ